MKRHQLEHIVRALAEITGETEFIAVGSQAALVTSKDLPSAMARSREIDVYVSGRPDLSDVIDGAIGEGSQFDETYGYYAQGVGPETARLPADWRARARQYASAGTGDGKIIAPEIHDLCVSKLIASREKDFLYVREARRAGLVRPEILKRRLREVPDLDEELERRLGRWIDVELA